MNRGGNRTFDNNEVLFLLVSIDEFEQIFIDLFGGKAWVTHVESEDMTRIQPEHSCRQINEATQSTVRRGN